jgi:hypothetical protein
LGSALDALKLKPFAVVPVIPVWSVLRVASAGDTRQDKGLSPVVIQIRATTPSILQHGDVLKVLGALGFNFMDPGTPGSCNSFLWDEPAQSERGVLLAAFGMDISCPVQGEIRITHIGASNITAGSHLSFRISTTNPRLTPRWTDNFWRFEHHRGNVIRAAGISTGYTITPQLEDVSIGLLGPLFAAQATSSVKVSFRVVSACDAVRITATSPPGFDFAATVAQVSINGAAVSSVSSQSSTIAPNVVDIGLVAKADDTITLTLANVKLGNYGGPTLWSIGTLAGGIENGELSAQGFRLAGLIAVLQSTLRNELDSELSPPPRDATEFALMSPWLPRVNAPAVAEFSVRFSNPVASSTELHVSIGTDYTMLAQDLKIFPFNTTGFRSLISTRPLPAPSNTTSAIAVDLLEPLLQNKDYVIILPLRTASNVVSLGHWRFELRDAAVLPMQTNDAQLPGFKLAEVFGISVGVGHAPPSAEIRVSLSLDFGVAMPTVLSIVPPMTFSFPSNCSSSALLVCIADVQNGRSVAMLMLPGGRAFSNSAALEIQVLSPFRDPALRGWSIQGLAVPADKLSSVGVAEVEGEQVGWGEYRLGFILTPLSNVVIRYAAIPLIVTTLSVSFDVKYRDGQEVVALRMIPPTSYRISCAQRYLKLVSLPEQNATCTPEPFTLKLNDGSSFPEGRQLFIMEVRVPSRTPQVAAGVDSMFRILLLDSSDAVLDADMEVPAIPVQSPLLQTNQAVLEWTSSAKGAETTITFGFRLKRSIPSSGQAGGTQVVGEQPIQVAALLLEMPAGFQHLIAVKEDVRNLNSEFPVANRWGRQWAEFDSNSTVGSFFAASQETGHNLRLLRIVRDQSQRVPVGSYAFRLPVRVPAVMPRDNVWHLSLCSVATCSSVDDASILISFVLPGFQHGEAPPETQLIAPLQSASPRRASLALFMLSALLLAFL